MIKLSFWHLPLTNMQSALVTGNAIFTDYNNGSAIECLVAARDCAPSAKLSCPSTYQLTYLQPDRGLFGSYRLAGLGWLMCVKAGSHCATRVTDQLWHTALARWTSFAQLIPVRCGAGGALWVLVHSCLFAAGLLEILQPDYKLDFQEPVLGIWINWLKIRSKAQSFLGKTQGEVTEKPRL